MQKQSENFLSYQLNREEKRHEIQVTSGKVREEERSKQDKSAHETI